jgi:hypothetical protein
MEFVQLEASLERLRTQVPDLPISEVLFGTLPSRQREPYTLSLPAIRPLIMARQKH